MEQPKKNNRGNKVQSYLSPSVYKKVESAANRQDVSKSRVINQALTEFFSKTKPAT